MVSSMNDTDQKPMIEAINLAKQCRPVADRVPKVGAVIAVNGITIAQDHRGTGEPDDDNHAELRALRGVADRTLLPSATLYTTLEPCTPDVRSDPLTCCTELICRAEAKRVFIGILDPNQGVRGKGLWELQRRGVEVELFASGLAQQIRILNENFIRAQQTLGIRITNPEPGQTIRTYDRGGAYEVAGTFLNPPGADVFAFTSIGGQWWPQHHSLHETGHRKWAVKIHFGTYGLHVISIVKANDLGVDLVEYYRRVCALNRQRRAEITPSLPPERLGLLGTDYPGIEMGIMPKGLERQAMVEVNVETPPKTNSTN
jgi:pyrimidine deaminase RibD-like protein